MVPELIFNIENHFNAKQGYNVWEHPGFGSKEYILVCQEKIGMEVPVHSM